MAERERAIYDYIERNNANPKPFVDKIRERHHHRVGGHLRRHLREFAGVNLVVTHDALEAVALADHLVVMEDGRILQSGSLAEVTDLAYSSWMPRVPVVGSTARSTRLTRPVSA